MTFSAWYDIEDGWDYVYVEASTDGGKKWQVLPGTHTTDKNPAGNAFGPGWTGISGGGKAPSWINEKVDLTPVTGNEVLVRFEYVTDDAVNGAGLVLDNIAIAELGYKDDIEGGAAGWQSAGWVLTDNVLSEGWLVQLVTQNGNTVQIQRMQVGTDGKGHLILNGAGQADKVVLIVSALAPLTTEPAAYTYTVSPR